MEKDELRAALVREYLYEEYFVKKFEDFLKRDVKQDVKGTISIIAKEAKGHAFMLQELIKRLSIDMDAELSSTGWVLQSLLTKKGASKTVTEFLNDALVEEIDLRKVYETHVKRTDDRRVVIVLNKIIKEEYGHEKKIRSLLKKD